MEHTVLKSIRKPWYAAALEVTAKAARFFKNNKTAIVRFGIFAVPTAAAALLGLQPLAAAPFVLGGAYGAMKWDGLHDNRLKGAVRTAGYIGAALAISFSYHLGDLEGPEAPVHKAAKHYYKLANAGKVPKSPGKTVFVNYNGASYDIKPGNAPGRFEVSFDAPSFWTGLMTNRTVSYDLARPRCVARVANFGLRF